MMDVFEMDLAQLRILGQVAVAMVLGSLIGLERQLADRPAGLRTHMMVAGTAALLVGIGDVLVSHFDAGFSSRVLRADPIRIIEAVITGVSFLGAGTIIRRQAEPHVEGLTTAASILLAAAVGICVALSRTTLATGVTVLALVVLRGLRWGEQRMGLKVR